MIDFYSQGTFTAGFAPAALAYYAKQETHTLVALCHHQNRLKPS